MQGKHILICGDRGIGKSTLIRKLLSAGNLPVYGFVTRRLPADETGFHPIYIHPAAAEHRVYTEENLIGTCDAKVHNISLEAFNTLGVQYIRNARPGGILLMDELGFMEANAASFVQAVFDALEGDIPVLAAVKSRYDVPFLNEVRAHPNATVYNISLENRDALYETLLPIVLGWQQTTANR